MENVAKEMFGMVFFCLFIYLLYLLVVFRKIIFTYLTSTGLQRLGCVIIVLSVISFVIAEISRERDFYDISLLFFLVGTPLSLGVFQIIYYWIFKHQFTNKLKEGEKPMPITTNEPTKQEKVETLPHEPNTSLTLSEKPLPKKMFFDKFSTFLLLTFLFCLNVFFLQISLHMFDVVTYLGILIGAVPVTFCMILLSSLIVRTITKKEKSILFYFNVIYVFALIKEIVGTLFVVAKIF